MLFSFLKDLLFPVECLGCQAPGAWACAKCLRSINPGGPAISLATSPLERPDKIYIAGDYNDPLLGEMIKKFKYNFITDLAAPLSAFLSFYWSGQITLNPQLSGAILVPIPLSRQRERWRGFNQAALLAEGLAGRLGLEVIPGLIRAKHRTAQARLTEAGRRKNINDAFQATGRLPKQRTIILIDDVVTTGATLVEAAATLKKSGISQVSALVLAKG